MLLEKLIKIIYQKAGFVDWIICEYFMQVVKLYLAQNFISLSKKLLMIEAEQLRLGHLS